MRKSRGQKKKPPASPELSAASSEPSVNSDEPNHDYALVHAYQRGNEGTAWNDNPEPNLTEDGNNRLRMEELQHRIQVTQIVIPTKPDRPNLDELLARTAKRMVHATAIHVDTYNKWYFLFTPEPIDVEGKKFTTTIAPLVRALGGIRFVPFGRPGPSDDTQPAWVANLDARKPVMEAMRQYLSRIYHDLHDVSEPFLRSVFLMCVMNAIPDQFRANAIVIPQMATIDGPLGMDGTRLVQGVCLELPSNVRPDERMAERLTELYLHAQVSESCADLYVDDIFSFSFPEEVFGDMSKEHIQLAKFILATCAKYAFGTTASPYALSCLADAMNNQYCAPRNVPGAYRGYYIVETGPSWIQEKRKAKTKDFYPTEAVDKEVPGLPTIHFPSSQMAELDHDAVFFRITEAAHLRFVESGSFEEAWGAACEMADEIKDHGDEILYPFCGESEDDRKQTLHCCHECHFVWPCILLERIGDRRVCSLCLDAADSITSGDAFERTMPDSSGEELPKFFEGTMQTPPRSGEKHPRPNTSDSTATERNQRQGFPPTEGPTISDSHRGATTLVVPAEQPQRTKTTTKEILQRLKKQFVPMAPSTGSDKGVEKQPVENNQGLTQRIADLVAAQEQSNQRQEESNQRQEQTNLCLKQTIQQFADLMLELQAFIAEQQERDQVLTQQLQESRAAHEQTNKGIQKLESRLTELSQKLDSRFTELSQKLGYLQEAVKRIERGVSKDQADKMIKIANAEAELAQENAAREEELAQEMAAKQAQLAQEMTAKKAKLAQEMAAKEAELADWHQRL
ncbi:hypothetical protein SLS58_002606 [Diplodia intermedia]|uniref:Uncharacterized protein n=1 Tax=Diplodia intermedia TaxID=856260 RepID=A0ABR3TZR5_9PEZI